MGYGSVIKAGRKKAGLTQEGLARRVGCTRTTVCDWEKEKYPPTDANNIAALEQAIDLENGELYFLIYGNANPTRPARHRAAN